MLEFPLANSEQAALMRLMTLPDGYSRESESEYFATRHRSGTTIPAPRSLNFFLNLNFSNYAQ